MALVRNSDGTGLKLRYYPTRLTDAELERLQGLVLPSADHAPTFATWFVGMLQDEQLRRMNNGAVVPASFPLDWPNHAYGQSLSFAMNLVRHAQSYREQRFADAVLQAVCAAAGARLMGPA